MFTKEDYAMRPQPEQAPRNSDRTVTAMLGETRRDKEIMNVVLEKQARIQFSYIERSTVHNPYDEEVRQYTSIENGDRESYLKSIREAYTGELGTLSDDPVRNERNMAIVNITLACRAAMRAGINPEVAYSLSDAEIQYCEVLTDLRELNRYRSLCELLFLNLVHEKKERERMKNAPIPRKGSPELTIESCKEYIACHLHEKILIRDIAKELFVNADYLSDIFHKKTGTTITQYIRQHKVQLICNMLTYSDYSYLEIATYFGYSSQSHLGSVFRKETGMTLQQYRAKYHVREFRK
jgi:AraC-like DNA-binding protein